MYTPGNILYFSPFYFPSGATPKNKYFIVLSSNETRTLIASLPTSKDHIPFGVEKKHGCIDLPERNFNCYYYESGRPITENGWAFPRDTYVYGEQIAFFDKLNFDTIYAIEDVDYEIIGKIKSDEFGFLIDCIKSSTNVKRKIRRALGAKI